MSFSLSRGNVNPVVSYYYDTGAEQRFTTTHALFLFGAFIFSFVFLTLHSVTSNVQLVSAETQIPNFNASVMVPATVVPSKSSLPIGTTSLQADINSWVDAHKGVDWAVSVEALDGSLSANLNEDQVFTLASIYKLFLLQPIAQAVPSSKWATTDIGSKSYAECIDAMLRVSDNSCPEAIGSSLGWGHAERHLRNLGYAKTSFIGRTTTGTTDETAALLKNLYNSEGFDALTRASSLDAMLAPKQIEGIRHGCEGCTVYNKTGDLAGYHNDAAIIEKDGKVYTVVIFSKTGSWQQIAELTRVIAAHL